MTYEKGVRLTVWDSYCGKTVLSPNNCLAQITVPTTLRTNSGLCTKRPSIHHYMTSLTPVRYQAVLGSLPGPGSILDRIRAAAEPNASKYEDWLHASCQTLPTVAGRRSSGVCGQERRKRAQRQEASRREAARVMAAHRISPQWGGLGATGCVAAASALPRCQLSPLHALFDEEARRDRHRGARARVRRCACRAAALQPPATACGHHGTERRRHGQLRRPGAAGGLYIS